MGLPGRRVAARIAWRQARRAPWRSSLIVATVAIPVAFLSAGLVFIETSTPTPDESWTRRNGSADVVIIDWHSKSRTPPSREEMATLQRELPPGSRVAYQETAWLRIGVDGVTASLGIHQWSRPIDEEPARGLYALTSGRLPTSPAEAVVHQAVLDAFDAEVGDTIRLSVPGDRDASDSSRIDLDLRVTGTLELPRLLDRPLVVTGWGALEGSDAAISSIMIDLPPNADVDMALAGADSLPRGSSIDVRRGAVNWPVDRQSQRVASAAVTGGTALALFGTGLVAAAAFVVGARRQLRSLGLLAASGAEPLQVSRAVTYAGLVLGLLGSFLGVISGIALAHVLLPVAEQIANERMGQILYPWLWLVTGTALGTLAALAAAYGPARSVASIPAAQALAGRSRNPRPPGPLARRGLAISVAGLVTTAVATATRWIPGIAIGLVVTVTGVLLAIPIVAKWAGHVGRWMPAAGRLAARNAARHGRRTGAALAAMTIVLALPVAVSAFTLSQETVLDESYPPLEQDQLALYFSPITREPAKELREFLGIVRDALPDALMVKLRAAAYPAGSANNPRENARPLEVTVVGPVQTRNDQFVETAYGPLWIGGPDLLRALHAEEGIDALRAGKVIAIGPGGVNPGGFVNLADRNGAAGPRYPAVEAGSSRYGFLSERGTQWNYVIAPDAAAKGGLVVDPHPLEGTSWILRAPASIDPEAVDSLRSALALETGGSVVAAQGGVSRDTVMRRAVTATAAGIAMVIVAVMVSLIAAESRRDQAILVAVGAGPWVRRKVAAMIAWLLATLGALLAIPAGFVPVIVIQLSRRAGLNIVVPWSAIGIAVIGLPLLAGLFGAAISRRPAAAQMLRPIA